MNCLKKHLNLNVFRKYDIRGIWLRDFDRIGFGLAVNSLLVFIKKTQPNTTNILLGWDTRISSLICKEIFLKKASAQGFFVQNAGVVTTPVINGAFLFNPELKFRVMITASHNNWSYTGIKAFFQDRAIWDHDLELIAKKTELITKNTKLFKKQYFCLITKIFWKKNILSKYFDFLIHKFKGLVKNQICIDAMHGAAGIIAWLLKKIFKLKNLEIKRASPYFLVKKCSLSAPDPTIKKNLILTKKQVVFSLDGDADRLTVTTLNQQLLLGDELLSFFCLALKKNPYKKSRIVTDVNCTTKIEKFGKKYKIDVLRSRVGIGFVKILMKQHKAQLGGESSCHFVFGEEDYFVDDGLFAIFVFQKVLAKEKLENLLKKVPKIKATETKRINSEKKLSEKIFSSKISNINISKLDGTKIYFSKHSWLLIRSSNTENCLSVRMQAKSRRSLLKKIFFFNKVTNQQIF